MSKAQAKAEPVAVPVAGALDLVNHGKRARSFGKLSDDCTKRLDAVRLGYEDALSGQRFLISMTSAEPAHPVNYMRPREGKACQKYINRAADDPDRLCCNEGYMKGLPELRNYVGLIHEPKPSSPEAMCRSDFDEGTRFAAALCKERDAGGDGCPTPPGARPDGYLGCYHLGFLDSFSDCTPENKIQRFMRRHAGSVVNRKLSGKADAELEPIDLDDEKKPKTAGSAQGDD